MPFAEIREVNPEYNDINEHIQKVYLRKGHFGKQKLEGHQN